MDIKNMCRLAKEQAYKMQKFTENEKNQMLNLMANAIENNINIILESNRKDVVLAEKNGKENSFIDRLLLNEKRIIDMAEGIREIVKLQDPIGEITKEWKTETGLNIKKVRTPIGLIAIVYEARPNVTADATALCIKSGNSVILKGGSDAINSNLCISSIMKNALTNGGYSENIIAFINDTDRESLFNLLECGEYVDLIIPRGGESLKKLVEKNATMPVIASAGGNCHIFVEKTANLDMAVKIIENAKCSRPSVCNALEQLLIQESIAKEFLPSILNKLEERGVAIKGDEQTCQIYKNATLAKDEDFYEEHISLVLTVKIINGTDEAIEWINEHSTRHSECIITEDRKEAEKFFQSVDSACVYHNVSIRFTDGFQFGYGAEMGISTQKLHIRGPIGLEGLTTEKLIINGDGLIRI